MANEAEKTKEQREPEKPHGDKLADVADAPQGQEGNTKPAPAAGDMDNPGMDPEDEGVVE
jgi:hypothetical protein